MKRNFYFIFSLIFLFSVPSLSFAAVPSPAVIEGTVIIDGTALTDSNDDGYTIKIVKTDGTALLPPAEDSDGMNSQGLYHTEIPLYDANDQTGGVNPGDSVLVNVIKGNRKLKVKSPLNGIVAVGSSGSITQIDIVAESNKLVMNAILNLLLADNDENGQNDRFKMTYPRKVIEDPVVGGSPNVLYVDELGIIYIMWNTSGGVYFIKSYDKGNTFTSPVEIFPPGHYDSEGITFAKNGDYIHTTWTYIPPNGLTEILYSRSADGGQSFDPPAYISLVDGINSVPSSIASNGSNYVGVFMENSEPGTGIDYLSYTFSEDNGETFVYPTVISDFGDDPQIAITDNYIYLVWVEDLGGLAGVHISVSDDLGRTFSEPVNICPDCHLSLIKNLHVADNGDFYIIVHDRPNYGLKNVRIFKTKDHGLTFDDFLAAKDIETRLINAVMDDEENIYICWAENYNLLSYDDIKTYFMYSTDKGVSFSGPILLPYIYGETRYTVWGPWLVKLEKNKILFVWTERESLDDPLYLYWSIGTIPEQ